MKRYFTACLFLICYTQNAMCNDSTRTQTYVGFSSGFATFYGLGQFNEQVQASGVKDLSYNGGSFAVSYYGKVEKWDISSNFRFFSLSNKTEKPQTQITLNYYSISMNFGYNLLPRGSSVRLAPFIGLGIPVTQLIITSQDSVLTTQQVMNGGKNMYYEQASIPLMFESGIRFCKFFDKLNGSLGVFSEASYRQQLKSYHWDIPDMPIRKLNNWGLSAGVLFRMGSK